MRFLNQHSAVHIALCTLLGAISVSCLKNKRAGQMSDAGITIPPAAAELGIETEFLMKT
jgi:hypothetical protein